MKAITFISFLLLSACASTDENLRMETARYLGGNISPNQVSVSNIDRGVSNVKWKATAPNGSYECWADDMVRKVGCAKK